MGICVALFGPSVCPAHMEAPPGQERVCVPSVENNPDVE